MNRVVMILPDAVSFQPVMNDDWELWAVVSWQLLHMSTLDVEKWTLKHLPEFLAKKAKVEQAEQDELEKTQAAKTNTA